MSILSRGGWLNSLFFVWIAVAAIGLYYVWPLTERPRRGIDLVGGFYITLKVDTDEAVKSELLHTAQSLLKVFKDNDVADLLNHKVDGKTIVFTAKTIDDAQKISNVLRTRSSLGLDIRSEGQIVTLIMSDGAAERVKEHAVEGNVDVLRKRLNELGVAEIPVSRQGEANIIIELPNVDNPAQAKEMIGKTSQLEIKEVMAMGATEDELLDKYDGILPENAMIAASEGEEKALYYLVSDYTDLTGRDLKTAFAGKGQHLEPVVNFEFNAEGAEKFSELTRNNRGRQLAILVDGKVISAPRVDSHIPSGKGYISGNFVQETAQSLATMLRSGAFLAPITFEEERRIGPSLGAESIKQGIVSCGIGLASLALFSVFFYKVCGLIAFLTLLYNMLLVILSMYWLNATLTLPGIAGMVLTVGMAIDASILIFEKIKEVLAEGGTFRRAVDVGFSDAMPVILDANITSFLVGLVLYKFGTGQVQGFAVTMMLGIMATLVSGLFFMRSIFSFLLDDCRCEKISI